MDLIIILLISIAVILLIQLMMKLPEEGSKCLSNPIVYYNELGDDKCGCLSGMGDSLSELLAKRGNLLVSTSNTIDYSVNFSEYLN